MSRRGLMLPDVSHLRYKPTPVAHMQFNLSQNPEVIYSKPVPLNMSPPTLPNLKFSQVTNREHSILCRWVGGLEY